MAIINPRQYLDLEMLLHAKLMEAWRPYSMELFDKVYKALEVNDISQALDHASQVNIAFVAAKNRDFIKAALMSFAQYGASSVAGATNTFFSVGNHSKMLDTLTDFYCKTIGNDVNASVYKYLLQLIAEKQETGVIKKSESRRYIEEMVDFTDAGSRSIQLTSSLNSSRLAVYGYTAEAEILGVGRYRITAVIDGRTSDICRLMDGKEFEVSAARHSIIQVLNAESIDEVKILQPWESQNKANIDLLATLSEEELVARNLHIPPYHPYCRTLLESISTTFTMVKPVKIINEAPVKTSTEDDFKKLGLKIKEHELKIWNEQVTKDPLDVLTALTNYTGLELLEGANGITARSISTTKNGLVKFKYKSPLNVGRYGATIMYDPLMNYVTINKLYLEELGDLSATIATKQALADVLTSTGILGSTKTYVTAKGFEALSFASMGMRQSISDWYTVSYNAYNSLLTGNLTYLAEELNPVQMKTVKNLLLSKNVDALGMLTKLPYYVNGEQIAEILFKDLKMDLYVDYTNFNKVLGALK